LQHTTSYYHTAGKHHWHKLRVQNTASHTKTFQLFFTAGPLQSEKTSSFRVLPKAIGVQQNWRFSTGSGSYNWAGYLGSTSYVSGDSLGSYTITLLSDTGSWISGAETSDGFNVSAFLVTGVSVGSLATRLPDYDGRHSESSYLRLDAADLKVYDTGQGAEEDVESDNDVVLMKASSGKMECRFETANQAGRGYQIVLALNHPSDESGRYLVLQSWDNTHGAHPFRLDPSLMHVSYGAGSGTIFSSHMFPTIVRVDGHDANNTLDIDGLPTPLRVHLSDANQNDLRHANCVQCVAARLMRCDDAASAAMSYPICTSNAQARCATAGSTKCVNEGDYLETLSGTTTADVTNGTALFTDIQLAYVAGAGYSLKFILNAAQAPTGCSGTWPNLLGHVSSACRESNRRDRDHDCCAASGNGACAAGYTFVAISGDARGNGCDGNYKRTCCLLEAVGSPTDRDISSKHGAVGSVSIPDNSYSSTSNRSFFVLPHSLKLVQDVGGDGIDTNLGIQLLYSDRLLGAACRCVVSETDLHL
jgi:hypothetical protein